MSEPSKEPGAEGPKKDTRSIIEKLRAQSAAKSADSEGPGAPQASEGSSPEGKPEVAGPAKPMSKLEAARAAAAKKQAAGPVGAAPSEPAGAGKPMSKLEAARAAAAGGGKPAAARAAGTPKGEAAVGVAGEAREKPPRPAPAKPARPKELEAKAQKAASSRRFFLLTWIGVAWASFTAGCVAAVSAGVRFLYPNVLQEPPNVFKIGPPDQFGEGDVSERWKNEYGVWVVRNEGTLYAIRSVCTHLGCTPNWLEGEQKFKCPCHGSGFRKTGINFEGPAPRPLERYAITIADDGQVEIDKGRKFQQELGQWTEENAAFIRLS